MTFSHLKLKPGKGRGKDAGRSHPGPNLELPSRHLTGVTEVEKTGKISGFMAAKMHMSGVESVRSWTV